MAITMENAHHDLNVKALTSRVSKLTKLINNEVEKNSLLRKFFTVDYITGGQKPTYKRQELEMPVWLLPGVGYLAEEFVEPRAEEVIFPTLTIKSNKDWSLMLERELGQNVISQAVKASVKDLIDAETEAMLRLFLPMITTKFWGCMGHIARPAPLVQIVDNDPASSYFSKELLSRMVTMAQLQGKELSHVLLSPEDLADVQVWANMTDSDRMMASSGKGNIWGIDLIPMKELGVVGKFNINSLGSKERSNCAVYADSNNDFNDYHVVNPNVLNDDGSLKRAGETQVIGLCKDSHKHFIMPLKKPYEANWDPTLLREQRSGFFGWTEYGVGSIGSRQILGGIVDRFVPGTDTKTLDDFETNQIDETPLSRSDWLDQMKKLMFG